MTNAETLIRKGKRGAAAFVQAECMANKAATDAAAAASPPEVPQPPAHLKALLDHLLHPAKDIGDAETIDWCRWLVGGGEKPEDFSHRGNGD
jgi:E3 ubiquitin-protein ligase UBR3